jgi:hypothetical protein
LADTELAYAALTTGVAGMTDLQEGTERTAELPLAVDVEADAVALALRTVEQLKGKRASLVDRIETNKRTSSGLAFDAFVNGGKARKSLDDYNDEAVRLDLDLTHLDAAIEEATRRHHAACAATAVKEERDRAALARQRFNEFGNLAQQFSDTIDSLIEFYGQMREVSAAIAATGFGPNERQIARWGQRLIILKTQGDRNLRFEDLMVDTNERQWLISAPKDWLDKLTADTAVVLEPKPAQAAE